MPKNHCCAGIKIFSKTLMILPITNLFLIVYLNRSRMYRYWYYAKYAKKLVANYKIRMCYEY